MSTCLVMSQVTQELPVSRYIFHILNKMNVLIFSYQPNLQRWGSKKG